MERNITYRDSVGTELFCCVISAGPLISKGLVGVYRARGDAVIFLAGIRDPHMNVSGLL